MPEQSYVVLIRTRRDGAVFKIGTRFTHDPDDPEIKRLVARGIIAAVDETTDTDEAPDDADLGAVLDRLVSEGHQIAALQEMSVGDFETLSGLKVKKADRVAALDLMIADDATAKAASADRVAKVADVIRDLGDAAHDDKGAVDPAKVRAVFDEGDQPDDATIAAAVAALALTATDSKTDAKKDA